MEAGSHKKLAIVQFDKEFGLLGRDFLTKQGLKKITTEHLPAVKGNKSQAKLIPVSQPILQSQKNTSTSSGQGYRLAGTDGRTGHP